MIDEKYYNYSREEITETDFWTNRLYNIAYDKVKDRKFPIVIPTYNRPENLFIKWATSNFTEDETWPIYLVVRKSQVNMYLESPYVKGYDYINVLGFEDDEINDIGKVRKKIVEHFSKSEQCVFMFDDDITKFTYTVPFKREKTNSKISLSVKNPKSPARVFAMWQVAMEHAMSIREDLIISNAMIAGFNWIDKFCDEDTSIKFMSGPQTLAVCINLKNFIKYDINYRTLINNGHDDIDMLIRAILAGCTTCEFRWLSYFISGIGTDILGFETVEKRFTQQYNEMYAHYNNIDFISWKHAKFDNVGINWRKAIKYHNEKIPNSIPINNNDLLHNLPKELGI